MSTATLPEGFADLLPFTDWCLASETERNIHRHTVGMPRILAFRDAILPRVDDIVAYLERNRLEDMPESDLPLMHMLLSLAEIAPAIEFYNQPAVIDGYDSRRFAAEENFVLRPAL
ncbi:hypothetical protein [Novosphingobium rosa]|uniref:hypothetical protein n=1 Tax=Novosphingobium rosa TaxID=76978 RepID=UPI000836E675|nr:hypothetical protein [Novosphingobium rosa]